MPTLTAAAEPANSPPRVLLNLNVSDVAPVPAQATITRADPDGRTRLVRLADPATLSAGLFTGYDYEAPFGSPVTYTATASSTVVTSTAVTLAVTAIWLRHPGQPSLSVLLNCPDASSFQSRSRESSRAVFTPLGRRSPIVLSGLARRSASTVLVARTETLEEASKLWDLLDDDSVLLLTLPVEFRWGVTHEYISIGDVQESRVGDWGAYEPRRFSLPYTVVDRPAGGLQVTFTYGDALAENATYSDLGTKYASYSDLLANRKKA